VLSTILSVINTVMPDSDPQKGQGSISNQNPSFLTWSGISKRCYRISLCRGWRFHYVFKKWALHGYCYARSTGWRPFWTASLFHAYLIISAIWDFRSLHRKCL